MDAAVDLHADLGPQEDGVVEPRDGALGFVGLVEGHAREALAAAALRVQRDFGLLDPGAVGALEEAFEVGFGGGCAEVLDEDGSAREGAAGWALPGGAVGCWEDGGVGVEVEVVSGWDGEAVHGLSGAGVAGGAGVHAHGIQGRFVDVVRHGVHRVRRENGVGEVRVTK